MKRLFLLSFLVWDISTNVLLAQKQVCITIDDLPTQNHYEWNILQEMTRKILASLQQYEVPAIGFINEGKVYDGTTLNAQRATLFQQWLDAGMELGNHTFSHLGYNTALIADMKDNVMRGEVLTRPMSEKSGKPYRYFRHPYLQRGNTPAKVAALSVFLQQKGYIEAPVTMDNGEWIFAAAYHRVAQKAWTHPADSTLLAQIGRDYVVYMKDKTAFFEKQTQEMLGRGMKHTLLIHANLLNADYLDELLAMFQEQGYQFISMEDALTDSAYQSRDQFVGDQGISWLHRWAITAKKPKSFYEGEPLVPVHILRLAGLQGE